MHPQLTLGARYYDQSLHPPAFESDVNGTSTTRRITSLDQFRGYTVAGMCLVNFLAPFLSVPAQLKHNESWFSYADSIMPSFFFVVGYSFRLTYLRRRTSTTWLQTAKAYLRRSLVLFGLSFAIYGLTADWSRWTDSGRMPAEFDPGRPMASATQSFTEAEQNAFTGRAIERVRAWHALGGTGRTLVRWRIQAARLFKAELWETLAEIAAAQLLVLPWIGFRPLVRFVVLIAYGLGHCALCAWFNWDFVYGVHHNWMSRLWMTGDWRSWDGGVFGPPSWAVAILAGTLAYDLAQGARSPGIAARRLFLFGGGFLLFGYSLSCVGRFYDLDGPQLAQRRERGERQTVEQAQLDRLIEIEEQRLKRLEKQSDLEKVIPLEARIAVLQDQRDAYPDLDLAPNPFVPTGSQAGHRSPSEWLADPPFVATPRDDARSAPDSALEHRPVEHRPFERRLWNYWMLGKRVPTLSFMTLASGLACVLYSLFVIGCDVLGLQLGVFRTFGTNALVAYFTHGMLALAVWIFVPSTAGLPIALAAFCLFFSLTWLLVRQLEKCGIYIKL
jgi:Heparan-alpha-glucosaminide N-acetyltransferase, catalytic